MRTYLPGIAPVQYPAIVRIFDQGFRSFRHRGSGETPRIRGLPYDRANPDHSILIAEKLRNDIRSRRIFVRSTSAVTENTPAEATPNTTVEKKTPTGKLVPTLVLLKICDGRTLGCLIRSTTRYVSHRWNPWRGCWRPCPCRFRS